MAQEELAESRALATPPPWYRRNWRDEVDGATGVVIAYGLCTSPFLCCFDGLTRLLIGTVVGGLVARDAEDVW